jgi:uncharacterized protein (DUF2132 family)
MAVKFALKRPRLIRTRAKQLALLKMSKPQTHDPLHGATLEMMVTRLVAQYGWDELGRRINIKCFTNDPSIASSLKFLRKTPWARQQVEALYLRTL